MAEPILSFEHRPRSDRAVMLAAGGILLVSGCMHALVWLSDGSTLTGPVSWRKPILFGLSAGVTLLSLGWLSGRLKPRPGDSVLLVAFSLAMLAEVGLITLQQWRGVPSHFNSSTPLDAGILAAIEWLILFVTLVIADLTWRSFRWLPTTPDMTLAMRGGMALLLFSCLLGFVLMGYGKHQLARGQPPDVFGNAGVMKFPHGVPMHAIQFLPLLSWILNRYQVTQDLRSRAVASALGSVLAFTALSLVQTFTGRARFDLSWISGIVLAVAVGLMFFPAYLVASLTVARVFRLYPARPVVRESKDYPTDATST